MSGGQDEASEYITTSGSLPLHPLHCDECCVKVAHIDELTRCANCDRLVCCDCIVQARVMSGWSSEKHAI